MSVKKQYRLEQLPIAGFRFEEESRKLLEADAVFREMTGYSQIELRRGIGIEELLHPDEVMEFVRVLRRDADKRKRGFYCHIVTKGKERLPVFLMMVPSFQMDGKLAYNCYMTEVTGLEWEQNSLAEQKQAEQKQAEQKRAERQIQLLKQAMELGQLELYIQPQYSLITGEGIGGEVLTRWKKDGKELLPEEFLPMLESADVIEELDYYIYAESLLRMDQWKKQGYELLPLSFNLSKQHFSSPGFVERMTSLADAYQIPKELICFEIKEEFFVESEEEMLYQIRELRENGFRLILDGFSGKYEVFQLLEQKQVDAVKLDREFSRESQKWKIGHTLFQHLLAIAQSYHIDTIYMGLETEGQENFFTECGGKVAQGYYFARPMQIDEFFQKYIRREG